MSGAEPVVAGAIAPEVIGGATAATAGTGAAATGAGAAGAAGAGAAGAGLLGAGTAAAGTGTAGALGGTALGAGGLGSLGGTAIGSSTSLGTGLLSGSTGVGLTAPAGALGGGSAAVVPGMEGALGTGLTGTASAAPGAGAQFASAAAPSTFSTPYTVSDAVSSLNSGYQNYKKVDTGVKAMSPQQQMRQAAPQAKPIFQGEQTPISPFGESALARMLMEKRMRGLNNGLLG